MKSKKKIGFTCSCFDLLHAGHVLMLAEAKEQCDHLIVAVQSNPRIDRPEKNIPIQSYEERLIMVKAIRWVDDVICYDTEEDLYSLLVDITPDVRIVGADWKGKDFTGHDLDIEVYFKNNIFKKFFIIIFNKRRSITLKVSELSDPIGALT